MKLCWSLFAWIHLYITIILIITSFLNQSYLFYWLFVDNEIKNLLLSPCVRKSFKKEGITSINKHPFLLFLLLLFFFILLLDLNFVLLLIFLIIVLLFDIDMLICAIVLIFVYQILLCRFTIVS